MENEFSKFMDKKDFFFQLGQKDGQGGKYRSREEISMLPDVGQISEDQFQEYLSGYQVGEEDSHYYFDEESLNEEAVVGENKIAKLEAEYVKNRSAAALQQLTKLSKMGKYDMKSLRKKMKQISETDQIELDEKRKKKKKKKAKRDACYHKVRARYDVWPSAYASGALVKCRKVGAANWGNKSKKKEGLELDDHLLQIIQEEYRAVLTEKKKKKAGSESSKESNLRDWFKRKGGKGSSSGWVDCNTCRKDKKTGRKKCSSCGRKSGEKRSKYPSCRPTPSACGERGRGKSWGKKSAKGKK